jgi:hypothetical protein
MEDGAGSTLSPALKKRQPLLGAEVIDVKRWLCHR